MTRIDGRLLSFKKFKDPLKGFGLQFSNLELQGSCLYSKILSGSLFCCNPVADAAIFVSVSWDEPSSVLQRSVLLSSLSCSLNIGSGLINLKLVFCLFFLIVQRLASALLT